MADSSSNEILVISSISFMSVRKQYQNAVLLYADMHEGFTHGRKTSIIVYNTRGPTTCVLQI